MKRAFIPYKSSSKELARKLRANATKPEIIFWETCLKDKKTGYKFLRQKPLDIFIADFYCPELLLVIEIDGPSHEITKIEDQIRTERLGNFGIKVVRYSNNSILTEIDTVKKDLETKLIKRAESFI